MMALFDKEYIMKVYVEDVVRDAVKEAVKEAVKDAESKVKEMEAQAKDAEEQAKKVTKEAAEKDRKTAESLLQLGKLSVEDIAGSIPDLSIEDVRQIQENMQRTL